MRQKKRCAELSVGHKMFAPLPSHGHLCLPGHLPACGAEAGCVTNLVTVVQHTGYSRPQG